MRKLLVLLVLLAFFILFPFFITPAQARPVRPTVAVVATDNAVVQASIYAWSIQKSPVTLVLAPSCDGYVHCIVTTMNPYYFEQSGNYGIVHGDVGDAIRGVCQVEVTTWDSRLLDHEWGHCLGLYHTTTDTKSIEYIGGSGPYTGNNLPDRQDYNNVNAAWS